MAVAGGFVGVMGGLVIVGRDVPVAAGMGCVGDAVSVGRGVSVGSAVAKGNVGKGVNVGKSKSNKAVGVACVPSAVKTIGLGTVVAGLLRDPRNKLNTTEQRQQNINKARPGKRSLPAWPCWLYDFFNVERNELSWFTRFYRQIRTQPPL
jgi:hypothetical protein